MILTNSQNNIEEGALDVSLQHSEYDILASKGEFRKFDKSFGPLLTYCPADNLVYYVGYERDAKTASSDDLIASTIFGAGLTDASYHRHIVDRFGSVFIDPLSSHNSTIFPGSVYFGGNEEDYIKVKDSTTESKSRGDFTTYWPDSFGLVSDGVRDNDYLGHTDKKDSYRPNDFTIEFWMKSAVIATDPDNQRILAREFLTTITCDDYTGIQGTQEFVIPSWGVDVINGYATFFFTQQDDNPKGFIPAEYPCNTNWLTYSAEGRTTKVSDGEWHHVAIVFWDSSWYIYVDGVAQSITWLLNRSESSAPTHNHIYSPVGSGSDLYIGKNVSPNGPSGQSPIANKYEGHLNELRISKKARYKTAFTVPTQPFVASQTTWGGFDDENRNCELDDTWCAYCGTAPLPIAYAKGMHNIFAMTRCWPMKGYYYDPTFFDQAGYGANVHTLLQSTSKIDPTTGAREMDGAIKFDGWNSHVAPHTTIVHGDTQHDPNVTDPYGNKGAIYFDGNGDYLENQHGTDDRAYRLGYSGRTPTTIEFWWKHKSHSNSGHDSGRIEDIILESLGVVLDGHSWVFRVQQDGHLYFTIYQSSIENSIRSPARIDDGKWHHIILNVGMTGGHIHAMVSCSGVQIGFSLYIDGAPVKEMEEITPSGCSPLRAMMFGEIGAGGFGGAKLTVGAGLGGVSYANGWIDDLRITRDDHRESNYIGYEPSGSALYPLTSSAIAPEALPKRQFVSEYHADTTLLLALDPTGEIDEKYFVIEDEGNYGLCTFNPLTLGSENVLKFDKPQYEAMAISPNCDYTVEFSINWSSAGYADMDIYAKVYGGDAVYFGNTSETGAKCGGDSWTLTLNHDAYPGCASTPLPPEKITGRFDENKIFYTWFDQHSNCTSELGDSNITKAITFTNHSKTSSMIVKVDDDSGTTIPADSSRTFTTVAYAGYNTGTIADYASGTKYEVTECQLCGTYSTSGGKRIYSIPRDIIYSAHQNCLYLLFHEHEQTYEYTIIPFGDSDYGGTPGSTSHLFISDTKFVIYKYDLRSRRIIDAQTLFTLLWEDDAFSAGYDTRNLIGDVRGLANEYFYYPEFLRHMYTSLSVDPKSGETIALHSKEGFGIGGGSTDRKNRNVIEALDEAHDTQEIIKTDNPKDTHGICAHSHAGKIPTNVIISNKLPMWNRDNYGETWHFTSLRDDDSEIPMALNFTSNICLEYSEGQGDGAGRKFTTGTYPKKLIYTPTFGGLYNSTNIDNTQTNYFYSNDGDDLFTLSEPDTSKTELELLSYELLGEDGEDGTIEDGIYIPSQDKILYLASLPLEDDPDPPPPTGSTCEDTCVVDPSNTSRQSSILVNSPGMTCIRVYGGGGGGGGGGGISCPDASTAATHLRSSRNPDANRASSFSSGTQGDFFPKHISDEQWTWGGISGEGQRGEGVWMSDLGEEASDTWVVIDISTPLTSNTGSAVCLNGFKVFAGLSLRGAVVDVQVGVADFDASNYPTSWTTVLTDHTFTEAETKSYTKPGGEGTVQDWDARPLIAFDDGNGKAISATHLKLQFKQHSLDPGNTQWQRSLIYEMKVSVVPTQLIAFSNSAGAILAPFTYPNAPFCIYYTVNGQIYYHEVESVTSTGGNPDPPPDPADPTVVYFYNQPFYCAGSNGECSPDTNLSPLIKVSGSGPTGRTKASENILNYTAPDNGTVDIEFLAVRYCASTFSIFNNATIYKNGTEVQGPLLLNTAVNGCGKNAPSSGFASVNQITVQAGDEITIQTGSYSNFFLYETKLTFTPASSGGGSSSSGSIIGPIGDTCLNVTSPVLVTIPGYTAIYICPPASGAGNGAVSGFADTSSSPFARSMYLHYLDYSTKERVPGIGGKIGLSTAQSLIYCPTNDRIYLLGAGILLKIRPYDLSIEEVYTVPTGSGVEGAKGLKTFIPVYSHVNDVIYYMSNDKERESFCFKPNY